jgi:hypothetical protein
MALTVRFPTAMVLVAGLATAPVAHAAHWHGDGHYYHHGGGNAAGAAIIGGLVGLVGLGVGAAIDRIGWRLLCATAGVLRSAVRLLLRTAATGRLLRLLRLLRRPTAASGPGGSPPQPNTVVASNTKLSDASMTPIMSNRLASVAVAALLSLPAAALAQSSPAPASAAREGARPAAAQSPLADIPQPAETRRNGSSNGSRSCTFSSVSPQQSVRSGINSRK